ncbi:MAG TPA: hypothetical protein VGQ16_18040 [Vicinamibacterales bacterium]|jgi:hypothetical protein|nr:hypothetical protein [Vicinamibacterales bacterium]
MDRRDFLNTAAAVPENATTKTRSHEKEMLFVFSWLRLPSS